jgi:hypothetical protein
MGVWGSPTGDGARTARAPNERALKSDRHRIDQTVLHSCGSKRGNGEGPAGNPIRVAVRAVKLSQAGIRGIVKTEPEAIAIGIPSSAKSIPPMISPGPQRRAT